MLDKRLKNRPEWFSDDHFGKKCEDLHPALYGFNERKLRRLLLAVRHFETYPATDTNRGRPGKFDPRLVEETCRRLKAILERETSGRISVQTFAGRFGS
jgi:hypothetical protein